jgi:PAS domain S-box-containing protein
MIDQGSTALQQAESRQDMLLHAPANLVNRDEYATLILDRRGGILSCGAPAEKIFGASRARLTGRQISEFIAGLLLGGTSPSYSARYLVHLCEDGEWKKFEAKNADGIGITVELSLSQIVTSGQEIFLLTVRRAKATS